MRGLIPCSLPLPNVNVRQAGSLLEQKPIAEFIVATSPCASIVPSDKLSRNPSNARFDEFFGVAAEDCLYGLVAIDAASRRV